MKKILVSKSTLNQFLRSLALAAIASLLAFAPATDSHGQGSATKSESDSATVKETRTELIRSIEQLIGNDVFMKAEISFAEPEADEKNNDLNVRVVTDGTTPFAGKLDVLCTAEAETIIATPSSIPGLRIYDDLTNTFVETAFNVEEEFSTRELRARIPVVTDWEHLVKFLSRSKEISVEKFGDKSVVYRCELPKKFLKADGGIVQRMMPVPMKIGFEAELANGNAVELRLTVVNSDPIAGVVRQFKTNGAKKGGVKAGGLNIGGGGQPVEGKKWIYRLRPVSSPVPDRLTSFANEIRKIK